MSNNEHKYTKDCIVVSSCYARMCHPETCCCDDNEAAIMDYKESFRAGHTYFGVVEYGARSGLERKVKEIKKHLTKYENDGRISF